jgi:hypothetical protein
MIFSFLPGQNMATLTPLACTVLIAAGLAVGLPAQQTPPRLSGNPTPGTPQPNPPDLRNRITVTGCVKAAEGKGRVPAAELNNPSDANFVLAARNSTSSTYRLSAVNSAVVPFVGARVEMSGEVDASQPPVLQVAVIHRVAKTCD